MQDHHHQGRIPLHGHKVAIGTLAATRLYEALFEWPVESLDIERIRANWPAFDDLGDRVRCTHRTPDLRAVALTELQAKYVDHAALQARLTLLQRSWPTLREGLRRQLIPSDELREMLQAAGAPQDSAEIGIEPRRLRRSHVEAQQIRRRYTVLDLALETGLLSPCLDRLFPGEES